MTDLAPGDRVVLVFMPSCGGCLPCMEGRPALCEPGAASNGAGTLLGNFVYNTVTTFYVGEKIMIQMPTWFFPSGAGPWAVSGKGLTHGEPNPTATFRFAGSASIPNSRSGDARWKKCST